MFLLFHARAGLLGMETIISKTGRIGRKIVNEKIRNKKNDMGSFFSFYF
jgi:hypothetical protein